MEAAQKTLGDCFGAGLWCSEMKCYSKLRCLALLIAPRMGPCIAPCIHHHHHQHDHQRSLLSGPFLFLRRAGWYLASFSQVLGGAHMCTNSHAAWARVLDFRLYCLWFLSNCQPSFRSCFGESPQRRTRQLRRCLTHSATISTVNIA